jgi:hypothetical protein
MNKRMSDEDLNELVHVVADAIDEHAKSRPQGCDRTNVNSALTNLLQDFGVEFEP